MNRTTDVIRNLAHEVDRANDCDSLRFDLRQIGTGLLELLDAIPSTHHPLGFYHFELTKPIQLIDARVRLHIWTKDSMRERDDLGARHAHTWSLASCVLTGALRDTWYTPRLAQDGSFHGIEVDYDEDVVRPTSRRYELETARTVEVSPGTVYRLPSNAPHQTDVLVVPCATLVVARESGLRSTAVFSAVPLKEGRSGQRVSLRRAEAVAAISAAFGFNP